VDDFNRYPNDIMAEYKQSVEEGLDIEMHKELFESVSKMENGEKKVQMSDLIFETVMGAELKKDYKYNEPNELSKIKELRKEHKFLQQMPN
jgi:hypothetical protein